MNKHKFLQILLAILVIASLVSPASKPALAMPMTPVDETKVPHYFGPYPNWANSPLTLPDAQVAISVAAGCIGTGATAEATVGLNGAITGITVTSPGNDYSPTGKCAPQIVITGSGTGAVAKATVTKSGAVVAVVVDTQGLGYINPRVGFSGGGGSGATATAYGGVNLVTITDGGEGYTFPTVEFDLPDGPNGVQAQGHVASVVLGDLFDGMDANGAILPNGVVVDSPGSGYSTAPGVAILNGTLFDPAALRTDVANPHLAIAKSSMFIDSIEMDTFGMGYNNPPSVTIDDPVQGGGGGSGATAHSVIDAGAITAITVTSGGSGYVTPGGIRKFVDTLPGVPGVTAFGANNLGQYIPLAVADTGTFVNADYYVIAVVQHREKMHSDLPPTLLREYVQLSTNGTGVALTNDLLDGTSVPALMPDGSQAYGVDSPHFLGPIIVAQKDKAVRIVFYNLLPTGVEGDLFLPVDTTIMGSGEASMAMAYDPTPTTGGLVTDEARNPMCTDKYYEPMMRAMCFTENRATLHLHGGNVPWISDGTPHQWITPATETTDWPEGVSVQNVPDMVGASKPANVPDCSLANSGCLSFYYTNQQSARLMFYHDHSWGITRLNVYAGEAAGYLIQDPTELGLVSKGIIPADQIPLVIQDRTFVPQTGQLLEQDPTWDVARWGGYGNLWYHHVYMPAQNPGDPGGMSAFGRWMYGPWFWPPNGEAKHGPIANPYFNMDPIGPDLTAGTMDDWTTPLVTPCSLDIPSTWQYQEDPFCEPEFIPGTPNISVGMEQFNDTPIVNGTAYPTVTLDPKTYRFRILNAANDRFWNLQWYVADATGTEVALKAAEVAAAQLDPVVFPTPDLALSPAGPDWIQIGTESGFLPAPVVVDGQQVTTWITDPTRFDVGNVDLHSLLLAPAERADVIVDFSKFAGKTLILYNDAPAAFPARIPSYDYYTGAPDLSPVGVPTILPGYGPNTRTIMQVKIGSGGGAKAFNLKNLQAAFRHTASGTGVFESGQHPIIVGQAGYNSAYGTSFAASGWCSSPNSTIKCDGFVRINQQGGDPYTFDTLRMKADGTYPTGYSKLSIPLEPKAIHDEMNSTNFDEYGRMSAVLGVEVVPATPGLQNVVLSPYVFPMTELIDTTNLPKADVKVTPIATASDGTQIWKITHNGVDTHPIHFHATDVQLLNRVTWDNIIIPPDLTELGWKETVRVSPLEDTIVAMRPVIPTLPFDFPNSIRLLSPMMADGSAIDLSSLKDPLGLGMTAFNPQGEPIDIFNHYVNFGAEYVYHCHILSHEEMDMMRAVLFAFPPVKPSGLAFDPLTSTLSWTDNSLSETAFVVEKWLLNPNTQVFEWTPMDTIYRPLNPAVPNTKGIVVNWVDPLFVAGDQYRVVAQNTVGDTWNYANSAINEIVVGGFPTVTATSVSEVLVTTIPIP